MAKPVKKKKAARAMPVVAVAKGRTAEAKTAKLKPVKLKPVRMKTVKVKPVAVAKAAKSAKRPPPVFVPVAGAASAAVLERLWAVIDSRRLSSNAANSHSARLLARGTPKVAQKLGEEAVELVIEAVAGNRAAIISESADVLYHLLVLWVDAGVEPAEVWAELHRREGISGIAEKASRPKALVRLARTTKLP